MKAIGYLHSLPVDHPDCLQDIGLPVPSPQGHDLLVEVRAVSVNPVDTKLRRNPANDSDSFKVLGFDAAGIVKAVGEKVSLFKPGDEVWYAGSIPRAGSNSEFQLVDERIVGRKPASIGFAEAASLPLTGITAWEMLFDRFGLQPEVPHPDLSLLIVGAAGGVGSVMLQLAQLLSPARVVCSASRDVSREWLKGLGAVDFVDHSNDVFEGLSGLGLAGVSHAVCLTHSHTHYPAIVKALLPQGKLGLIDDPQGPIDILQMKRKSLSLHWEFMFTRPLFGTADLLAQHHILNRLAFLVDAGLVRHTMNVHLGVINAENLRRAHGLLESGMSVGKVVLEGFD